MAAPPAQNFYYYAAAPQPGQGSTQGQTTAWPTASTPGAAAAYPAGMTAAGMMMMPSAAMYSQYWPAQPVLYQQQYNPQMASAAAMGGTTMGSMYPHAAASANGGGGDASAADFGEFVSGTTSAASVAPSSTFPAASASAATTTAASSSMYGGFVSSAAPSASSAYGGFVGTSALPAATSASTAAIAGTSLYGGYASHMAPAAVTYPSSFAASSLLTPSTTQSFASSSTSTLSPLMSTSSQSSAPSARAPAAASSSPTVSNFFASLIKPAQTSPSTGTSAPAAAPRPSLNVLASGPPASFSTNTSVLSGITSTPGSSAAALSTEFEDFVSAPTSTQPIGNLSSAAKGTLASPPVSGGFSAPSVPSASLPTPLPTTSFTASISSVPRLDPLATGPSSSVVSSLEPNFESFLSASGPASAGTSTNQPPTSQGSMDPLGAPFGVSSSPIVTSIAQGPPASSIPSSNAGTSNATGDDDWSFMTAGSVSAQPKSEPAAKTQAPAASAASSRVDSLMHKFANMEKKTLAGEAAKKPEARAVTAPPVSQQPVASKNQSARAFNWNDDSYRNIFASLPVTQPSQPSTTSVSEEDFGEFVSDTATTSANAPATAMSGFEATGGAARPPEATVTQIRPDFETANFTAVPVAMASNFQSAAAAYEYYTQMAAAYGAPMAFSNQTAVLTTQAPASSVEDQDGWTDFASQTAITAPTLPTSTAPAASQTSSTLSSIPFVPSSSASSTSTLPFSVTSSPLLPTPSTTAAPASSSAATPPSSTGVPLVPSTDLGGLGMSNGPDIMKPSMSSISANNAMVESSEFGSFASFNDGVVHDSGSNGAKMTTPVSASPAVSASPLMTYPGQIDWQEHTLRQCLTQLQQGSVLFQQLIEVSDVNLLNKTLKSDKVDVYVLGLCEVYKIGRRMSKRWQADVAKELRPQIDDAWAVLQAVLAGLSFSPSIDLQRWQEQLDKSEKQSWSGRPHCKLCMMPVTPLEAQIQLHGSLYHAPCANFYASLRQIPSASTALASLSF